MFYIIYVHRHPCPYLRNNIAGEQILFACTDHDMRCSCSSYAPFWREFLKIEISLHALHETIWSWYTFRILWFVRFFRKIINSRGRNWISGLAKGGFCVIYTMWLCILIYFADIHWICPKLGWVDSMESKLFGVFGFDWMKYFAKHASKFLATNFDRIVSILTMRLLLSCPFHWSYCKNSSWSSQGNFA